MTFTPKFQKVMRRKKRQKGKPAEGQPTRQEIRQMVRISGSPTRPTYATAVLIADQPDKVGIWVWKETAPNFKIAGDIYSKDEALGVLRTNAPEAKLISAKEFHERTKHVRAAMDVDEEAS